MASRIFADEPTHSMEYDITAQDWQDTPANVLHALMWAAAKAKELCEMDARALTIIGSSGGVDQRHKLLGYAAEWDGIATNAAEELRSREIRNEWEG